MNTQARIVVGVLVAAVVGLGIAVGVMAAGDGRHDGNTTAANRMMENDTGYTGMMVAMGSMDRDGMLSHMREVVGEDGYQRMLAHMTDHQGGTPMGGNAAIDQTMHTMMDGMIRSMPMGGSTLMPPGDDLHHGTPTPATTPTP